MYPLPFAQFFISMVPFDKSTLFQSEIYSETDGKSHKLQNYPQRTERPTEDDRFDTNDALTILRVLWEC